MGANNPTLADLAATLPSPRRSIWTMSPKSSGGWNAYGRSCGRGWPCGSTGPAIRAIWTRRTHASGYVSPASQAKRSLGPPADRYGRQIGRDQVGNQQEADEHQAGDHHEPPSDPYGGPV